MKLLLVDRSIDFPDGNEGRAGRPARRSDDSGRRRMRRWRGRLRRWRSRSRPDVVVSDLHLGDRNGIALARQLGARCTGRPGADPDGCTARRRSCTRPSGAGAGGYALKAQSPAEIIAAIRSVGPRRAGAADRRGRAASAGPVGAR